MQRLLSFLALLPCLAAALVSQVPATEREAPKPLLDGVSYDARVPRPEQVLGYAMGDEVSDSRAVEQYLQQLDAASDRVQVVQYGASWLGRPLYYAIISAPSHVAQLVQVRAGMQQLADPRLLDAASATQLLDQLPAPAWLGHCVHGDEPSGVDASLHLAHHLAAAVGDPVVDRILDQCLVLLDPLQNPDGLDRFVASTRAARGRWADATPRGAEHSQPWPGGRVNHALFDMNRDWFAMTQPETRARVQAFLTNWPVVHADLHEMGGDSTFYFSPPAEPIHGEISGLQREWLLRYGRNNAKWFDQQGFTYFTRENYDSFYPGYGEGWPTFHGSIGMTYEMASSRGLVYRRANEELLHYEDCVRRHFIAGLATLETLSQGRREALQAFTQQRLAAVQRGETGPIKEYVFPSRGDRTRLARFARLLSAQGIEVHQAVEPLQAAASALGGGDATAQTFPVGSLVVSMAQPGSTLAHVLIQPHFDMQAQFLAEQQRREQKRLNTEFYDLTAWSLPLLFGLECWQTTSAAQGARALLPAGEASTGAPALRSAPPKVAYVIAWGENGAAGVVAELLRKGVKMRCIDRAFVHAGREFPAGSVVVSVHRQPAGLHAMIAELAARYGVDVHCADASWMERGPDFGSENGHWLKTPQVALLWDRPTNANSVGWARYLLERSYGVPVAPIRVHDVASVELERFTVLILPEGGDYEQRLGASGVRAIVAFVENGGVVVSLGSASRWLTKESVGLLASETESRQREGDSEGDRDKPSSKEVEPKQSKQQPFDYSKAILPEKERPPACPGAIVAVDVDADHWLGFGYRGAALVVHDSANIFVPVKLDRGTNVAIYAPKERLVRAGFLWEESKQQLPQKAYLLHQPRGRGHVVAFAEDPNVRGFADGLHLFFLNAVLLTAGR